MSIGHHQWSGNIPHEGPLEECEWCNPKLRKREVETMSDDIVAELRSAAIDHDSTGYMMEKAADAIERKDAEIEQLYNERQKIDHVVAGQHAEIAKLRAALAWIDNGEPEAVAAAEAKFGFSLALNPKE